MNHVTNLATTFARRSFAVIAAAALISGFFVSSAHAAISTINLDSPNNAGLEWRGTQTIEWNGVSDNVLDTVDISYASDGINYTQLVASGVLFLGGSYSWDTTPV